MRKDSAYYEEVKKNKKAKVLTWKDFQRDVQMDLCNGLDKNYGDWLKYTCKGVYAVPRGGYVVGLVLSSKYNLPMLAAPCDNCLIAEDIIHTGLQSKPLIEKYVNNGLGVLVSWLANPDLHLTGTYSARPADINTFYSFPWDH